jgi:hypothetical protein
MIRDNQKNGGDVMAHERELTLDELLSEPIIRKVMKADGYTPDDIRRLVHRAGARKPFVEILKPSKADFGLQRLPALPIKAPTACCAPLV